jgi:prepilin-type N-terminal cleavage/methylation domain-containing protein
VKANLDSPVWSTSRPRRVRPACAVRRRAFTLIEILTVIIILGMLITLAAPSIVEARKLAKVQESMGRISSINGGIGMFRTDTGKLPPSNGTDWPGGDDPSGLKKNIGTALKGRHALVEALTGYLAEAKDLRDGRGFRLVTRGRVYGPYLDLPTSKESTAGDPPSFIDAFGNDIYYYTLDTSVAGTNATYNTADNADGPTSLNEKYLRERQNSSGKFYIEDYVLITKGPDRAWESFPTGIKRTDDLASFTFLFPK